MAPKIFEITLLMIHHVPETVVSGCPQRFIHDHRSLKTRWIPEHLLPRGP